MKKKYLVLEDIGDGKYKKGEEYAWDEDNPGIKRLVSNKWIQEVATPDPFDAISDKLTDKIADKLAKAFTKLWNNEDGTKGGRGPRITPVEREQEPLRPDDQDFEGLRVVSLEEDGQSSAIKVLADFLHRRHRIDTVGCLTLGVIAVECYAIHSPTALIAVVSLTVLFASFVILIGRHNATTNTASHADDAGASADGTAEAGEAE